MSSQGQLREKPEVPPDTSIHLHTDSTIVDATSVSVWCSSSLKGPFNPDCRVEPHSVQTPPAEEQSGDWINLFLRNYNSESLKCCRDLFESSTRQMLPPFLGAYQSAAR